MTQLPANSRQQRRKKLGRTHLRGGIFLLATASFFSIGLYFWPTPIRGHVARVSLALWTAAPEGATASPPTAAQQATARSEVFSAELVQAALEQVGPPPSAARSAAPFPTAAEVDFVRQRLQLEPGAPLATSEAAIDLTYTGADAAWSLEFVTRLANQAVARLDERAARAKATSSGSAANRLALAERYEQAARAALDDFLNHHFDEFNRLAKAPEQAPRVGGVAADLNSSSSADAPTGPQLNPKWQSLTDQILTATAELDRILLDRTLEHPQAKEVSAKLDALRRQLESTPKHFAAAPTVRRTPVRSRSGNAVQRVQFSAGELRPDVNQPLLAGNDYERLLAELRKAREERHTALRESGLQAKGAAPAATVVRGRIVATAHVVQTLREPSSTGRLTVLALLSVFSGACLAALIRNARSSTVYASLAEIEQDLALPVVGVVSPSVPLAIALSR